VGQSGKRNRGKGPGQERVYKHFLGGRAGNKEPNLEQMTVLWNVRHGSQSA